MLLLLSRVVVVVVVVVVQVVDPIVYMTGAPATCYVSAETPMVGYVNLHAAVQRVRDEARAGIQEAPRVCFCWNHIFGDVQVLVVGPNDTGKSSLCRLLLNYAVREGSQPLFLDLDTAEVVFLLSYDSAFDTLQSMIGMPGALNLARVCSPMRSDSTLPPSIVQVDSCVKPCTQ
jgi:hypothetical protein